MADNAWMVYLFTVVVDRALSIWHLAILVLTRCIIVRFRLDEVVHVSWLSRSWWLLVVTVMTPHQLGLIVVTMVEVFGQCLGSLHVVIWILRITPIIVECCVAILNEIWMISSLGRVLTHTCHSCCHVIVPIGLFAIGSPLILHTHVLSESIVFFLTRAEVIWDQSHFMRCGWLWLELRVVLHTIYPNKVM